MRKPQSCFEAYCSFRPCALGRASEKSQEPLVPKRPLWKQQNIPHTVVQSYPVKLLDFLEYSMFV